MNEYIFTFNKRINQFTLQKYKYFFVNGIFPHKIQNMLDLQDLYKQIKW